MTNTITFHQELSKYAEPTGHIVSSATTDPTEVTYTTVEIVLCIRHKSGVVEELDRIVIPPVWDERGFHRPPNNGEVNAAILAKCPHVVAFRGHSDSKGHLICAIPMDGEEEEVPTFLRFKRTYAI